MPAGVSGAQALLLVLGLAASLVVLHSVFVAPRRLRLLRVDATIAGLDPAFDGYTIGVLSDLHQAAIPGLVHTVTAVELIAAARPELITILGDFGVSFKRSYAVSRRYYRREMRRMSPVLRSLRAPDGVLAVLGNHDHYYNAPAVRDWLGECGVRVLVNDRHEIRRGSARLVVAGIDDVTEGAADPMAGCEGVSPEVPKIVLSHNPDGVLELSPSLRPGLVLSGHTHGGQIVLPFYGAPLRFARVCGRKSARGWVPNLIAPLFVSAGVGSQIPLRFNCIPDVVIVRLRSAS